MLGTRTKQVNSYGRRGSRIINASDRRDRESANSSDIVSDADAPPLRPVKRENAIVISPAKPRVELPKFKSSNHSPRNSSWSQSRNVHSMATRDAATKRIQANLHSSTYVRQPLTPLRANGASSNGRLPSGAKPKCKDAVTNTSRTSLKPHASVIPVDIIVLDDDGNMLTQERRLSHSDLQTNQVCTAAKKGKGKAGILPPSPLPIVISDESDLEITPPKLAAKRLNPRRPVVISSDEYDKSIAPRKTLVVPPAKSHLESKSLRVEVVIPCTPRQKSKAVKKILTPAPLALNPPRVSAILAHGSQPILAPPIPIAKQRQLTPIRGSSVRSALRCALPTPSTPTDADLSLDFAQLDLSDAAEADTSASAQPQYLIPLLNECAQFSPFEFSAFIETFPFDPIVQSSTEGSDAKFRKIGEASYSEVFGIGDVVLKIVPIQSEGETVYPEIVEVPAPSDAEDVLKEIVVTREIGDICGNFVKLLKTYIVRGRYPSLLLDLWDEYNEKKGSESVRPDLFGLRQIYAIIILPNGGPDLESFVFKNASKSGWRQACGIFWQVARALEQAEHLANFEHRDLHWGQILVKSIPIKRSRNRCDTTRVSMDDACFGVKVTIIDLGLSRMNAVDGHVSKIYWTPFDQEIFEGEGDYQYDIYRMMRDHAGSAWESYHPFTNVMWLHYLADKLLYKKRLKFPSGEKQNGGTGVVSPMGYGEQECYDCLAEMEKLLSNCIASARQGQKTRRKMVSPSREPKSAGDVIAYGARRGWVKRRT